MAWSEDGKYCFCVNELASTLSVLRYEQDELVLLDTVDLLPEYQPTNTAAAIRVIGEYIYISIRGCDQIVTLQYRDGAFTQPKPVSAEGKSPRDIHVMGDLLFSTNESSDSVTVFRRNGDSLEILDQQLSLPKPLCVVFRDL